MSDTFHACTLPWSIWPWGLTLTHSDSDELPECSVEFGAMIVRPTFPYEELWVRVDFAHAAFASTKPHRDDEDLVDVSAYHIVPKRRAGGYAGFQRNQAEWLRAGTCPDPSFYFSADSRWLQSERHSWAARQRMSRRPEDAVHFLLDGRDGYIEILASGFSWRAWRPGRPMGRAVSGEPVMSGEWVDGGAPI
jgi:hypothetical protein